MGAAFSDDLEAWLHREGTRTFGELADVFGEKGFAVTIILLMSIPAIPLPTGGVTHVFEAVTVLIGAEMVVGRRTLWLPDRIRRRELGPVVGGKAVPFIIRRVRWFEKHSRRRLGPLFGQRWFRAVLGLIVIAFAVAAALAPPFSGLDTIPALGAVIVALAIILEDAVVLVAGVAIGLAGIALMVSIGAALAHFLRELL
ncbi:MAG TPA: exopolysaccharide biosynthesis protein [Acidimicrobiales bacterium]